MSRRHVLGIESINAQVLEHSIIEGHTNCELHRTRSAFLQTLDKVTHTLQIGLLESCRLKENYGYLRDFEDFPWFPYALETVTISNAK